MAARYKLWAAHYLAVLTNDCSLLAQVTVQRHEVHIHSNENFRIRAYGYESGWYDSGHVWSVLTIGSHYWISLFGSSLLAECWLAGLVGTPLKQE